MMAASRVSHGRRKGQERGSPTAPVELNINGQIQSAPANSRTSNLKEVCVLSKNDWNRIQMQLHQKRIEEERRKAMQQEKIERHERSLAETKNWANTIVGQRQKKLEAHKIRETKEEEEKQIIDIEEAKYQAEQRKEAIEKAKTKQYYQTDRVKKFHSALQLTEVLKERDCQLELKRLREVASAGKDKDYLISAQRELEDWIQKDQQAALERINRNKNAAKFQQAQCNQHMKQLRMENEENLVEGENLKRLNAQYVVEKQKLDAIRKEEAHRLMEENLKQIDDVYRTRKMQKRQEEEEDEECRIFAAAKRKMMKLRVEKERQLHNEKQEQLEGIRRILHAQNLQKIDDEDDRIRRAVEEADGKREKEEQMKKEKTEKDFAEIAKHRHDQMKLKELEKLQERKKEKEMLAMKREIDAQFAKNEQEKTFKKFEEARHLTDFHLKQLDERRGKEHAARIEQLAQDAHNLKLIGLEEQQFQEYAQKVIAQSEKGSRNVYPLKKAAQEGIGGGLGPLFTGKGGIRPSYMSCDQQGIQLPYFQRGTTDDVKKTVHCEGTTDKRLGFVW